MKKGLIGNPYNLAAEWWRVIVRDMWRHPLSWIGTLRRPPPPTVG